MTVPSQRKDITSEDIAPIRRLAGTFHLRGRPLHRRSFYAVLKSIYQSYGYGIISCLSRPCSSQDSAGVDAVNRYRGAILISHISKSTGSIHCDRKSSKRREHPLAPLAKLLEPPRCRARPHRPRPIAGFEDLDAEESSGPAARRRGRSRKPLR